MRMKKILSVALAAIMIAGVIPSEPFIKTAHAYGQGAAKLDSLAATTSGSLYTLDFRWSRATRGAAPPANSGIIDLAKPDGTPWAGGRGWATNYKIFWRNATAGEAFMSDDDIAYNEPGITEENRGVITNAEMFETDADVTTPEQKSYRQEFSFAQGSFYVFKMGAAHEEQITKPNSTQPPTNEWETNADESGSVSRFALLTDIQVSAKTIGMNKLRVTWNQPLLSDDNGRSPTDPFTSYRIYYGIGGSRANLGEHKKDVVPDVAVDGKYTVEIDAGQLIPGMQYAVAVEPIYNGVPIRNTSSTLQVTEATSGTNKITVNGNTFTFVATNTPYRINDVIVTPSLEIKPMADNKILAVWSSFRNNEPGSTPSPNTIVVDKMELYYSKEYNADAAPPDDLDKNLLAVFSGDVAMNRTEFLTNLPGTRTTTWFYYDLSYKYRDEKGNWQDGKIRSDIAMYNPDSTSFAPTKPDILEVVANYPPAATDAPPTDIDITWKAFQRFPVTDEEKEAAAEATGGVDNLMVDTKVDYTIWVTDDVTRIDDANLPSVAVLNAADLEVLQYVPDPKFPERTIPAFKYKSPTYWSYSPEIKTYVENPVTDNMIYYFKVQIARQANISNGETAEAYAALYVPASGDIDTNPLTLGKPPLRIALDAQNKEKITTNSITVTWNTNWVEAYDSATDSWFTEIGIDDGGNLIFGKNITEQMREQQRTVSFEGQTDWNTAKDILRSKLESLNFDGGRVDLLPMREMRFRKYEPHFHVVPKSTIDAAGGYEEYINSLLNGDLDADGVLNDSDEDDLKTIWGEAVTTEGDNPLQPEYTVTQTTDGTALVANEQYVIIFRAFSTTTETPLMAYYPTYVMGTTLIVPDVINVIPTVPAIIGVSSTDTSVTVKWLYSDTYQYTLYWAELVSEYPDGGFAVDWDTINVSKVIRRETSPNGESVEYLYYTVTGLFPKTMYYFWLTASVTNELGTNVSAPSNAITMTTQDINAPNPPEGLGLASEANLDIINKENDTTYEPITFDYMIIEWLKDARDTGETEGAGGGGGGASGATEQLTSESIVATLLVKFNTLTANKTYYVRAKTRLILTKGGDDGAASTSAYQYIVQLSLSPEFTDVIEAVVPPGDAPEEAADVLVRESAWTETYHFVTSRSGGEYDGDKNDNMYPLPVNDFDIYYNAETDSLSIRLRSDKIDSTGAHDNLTDQRFISKLIQNNTHNYVIDATKYNNKAVANKVVELPYSVLKAFEERKISLTLISGATTYTFMPGFSQTAEVKKLQGNGNGSSVVMTIRSGSNFNKPELSAREAYSTEPQKLEMTYSTPKSSTNIQKTATPMSISLRLKDKYATLDSNVGAYTASGSNWSRVDSVYDEVSGQMNFSTVNTGTYAGVAVSAPKMEETDLDAQISTASVQSRMNIQDVGSILPKSPVTASQFNKILSAVAKGSKDVRINDAVTTAETNSLTKAGILAADSQIVSREAALSALAKLYEIKTKTQIKNYSATSVDGTSEKYKAGVQKAAFAGLFDGLARPKDGITFAELLKAVDVIMADAGL